MLLTFLLISTILSMLMFLFMSHPLSFGLILLVQTLVISLITGLMTSNFWFSYILFLVMVGGMLILFIYMTSIASNEKFKFSSKLLIFFIYSIITTVILTMLTDPYLMSNPVKPLDLASYHMIIMNQAFLTKYLNWPIQNILYMMFIYLLVTLIMVVKITKIQHGPIRQKF